MTKPSAHAPCVLLSRNIYLQLTHIPQKANFRRTNVATKLKLTYVKDNFLDVSPYIPRFNLTYPWFVRSKFNTKLVGIHLIRFLKIGTFLIKYPICYLGDDWTDCFFIPKVTLPPTPFLGFTAMTGDVSDAHEYALPYPHTFTLFIYMLSFSALSPSRVIPPSCPGRTWDVTR